MRIENQFTVNAPVQQAWGAMLDLERVAPCLPGASIEEAAGEEYQGTMAVKLGPISARYRGTVRIEEADEENYRMVLRADGKETRGQGTASATITSTMNEENDATRVHVETDMEVTGWVAQFGPGIMQDVATELIDRFSACVEREIVEEGAEEEPEREAASAERSSGASAQEEPETLKIPPRETQPLDLGDVSREAVVKRAVPAVAGLVGLGLVALLIRLVRRPSFSMKFEIRRH